MVFIKKLLVLLICILPLVSCELTLKENDNPLRVLSIGMPNQDDDINCKDAMAFSSAMEALSLFTGDSVEVKTLTQMEGSEDLIDSIRQYSGSLTYEDTLVVYLSAKAYAGCDLKTKDGKEIFFDARDRRYSLKIDHSLRYRLFCNNDYLYGDEFLSLLNEIECNVFLIADCDRSGSLVGSKGGSVDISEYNVGFEGLVENSITSDSHNGIQIMASERRYEADSGSKAVGGNEYSLFTAKMIDALGYDLETNKMRVPPSMKDGEITINSLYKCLSESSDGYTPKLSGSLVDTVLFSLR